MDDLQYCCHLSWYKYSTTCVLNLIINGWPSIPKKERFEKVLAELKVLNLIINGWPSIQKAIEAKKVAEQKVF